MRIKKLHLTRYGKFTNFTLDFGERKQGESDFHIIYGLNEAGKSTTFSAWLDFLFGMGRENSYNFLHDYKAMKIGACLETANHIFDLQRIKANKNSLLDASENPFNEMALLTNMAGLTRDSYKTMFSLDDDSLVKGGDDILNSKGDLGEILFSASAGLDGISEKLAEIEKTANDIYRKSAPSTKLQQLKKRLGDLKQESNDIDIAASQYKRLAKEKRDAEEDYEKKNRLFLEKNNDIEKIGRQIELRKKLKYYGEIKQDLTPFENFPMPPGEWRDEMDKLWQNDTALHQRKKSEKESIARLQEELKQNAYDPNFLKLSETIKLLAETPKSRFTTAKGDISKRFSELAQKKSDLDTLLNQFNQSHLTAKALIIDDKRLTELKSLLRDRPLIIQKIETANHELTLAQKAVSDLQLSYDDETSPPLVDNETIIILETRINEIQEQGLIAQQQRLATTITSLENSKNQQLVKLSPFTGTASDLACLKIPAKDYWAEQYQKLQRLNDQISDLNGEQKQISYNIARLQKDISTFKASDNLVDTQTLQKLADERSKSWQDHYIKLDHDSANQFSLSMQKYDEAINSRLWHFERIAQLEQAEIELQEEQNRQKSVAQLVKQKESEVKAIDEYVFTNFRQIGFVDNMPVMAAIKILQDWLTKREDYIVISEELEVAKLQLDTLQSSITKIANDITQNLPLKTADTDIKALLAIAKNFIETQKDLSRQKAESKRAINKATQDIEGRQIALLHLQQAFTNWQTSWQNALQDLWLNDIKNIEEIASFIEKLQQLPELVQQCDSLEHRINAMKKDMNDFLNEVIALSTNIDTNGQEINIDNVLIFFNDLQSKVLDATQKAKNEEKTRSRLSDMQEQYEETRNELDLHMNVLKQRFDYFKDSDFSVTDLADLSKKLDLAKELYAKQQELAKCERDIKVEFYYDDIDDAIEEVDMDSSEIDYASLNELKSSIEPLIKEKEEAFALLDSTRKQLDAIGGDDKVAMLESKRQTTRLEIEELAFEYLKLKAGWILAQEALVKYRDAHRSSMLDRASKAFNEITSGNYTGLTTQLEGSKENLIALGNDGMSKLSSDLSKGTRFQLYLALRFAGYQEFAQNHEPIPFIADDIMETFDEPRASEALRLMAMMAKTGQVIYLTHHRHICDLALASVDNVTIHNLP